MTKEIILALVRHLLTGIGSVLMARGYVDSGTVEAVIGGVLAVVGLGLSYKDKLARA